MVQTTLQAYKSKRACPVCHEKKLTTNDIEKFDEVMHYHCLNCGYEFFENEEQRKFNKDKANKEAEGEQPWAAGTIILILMVAAILSITLSEQAEDQSPELSRPTDRTELRR
ncbi:MAG: hypothetical protein WBC73_09685 [Phormidesmis sp.]